MRSYKLFTLLVLGVLLVSAHSLKAQLVSAYTMSSIGGTYSAISGTTMISGTFNDDVGATIVGGLPFSFKYDGTTYPAGSTVFANTNGSMSIGSSIGTLTGGSRWGSAYATNNAIMPFSTDLYLVDNSNMQWVVTGSAPNRVLTIQWTSFYIYGYPSWTAGMQVKLYETSSMIEYWYSNLGYTFSGTTLQSTGDPSQAIVGLHGASYSTNNKYYSTSLSAFPTTHLRFSPLPNVQLTSSPKFMDFGSQLTGNPVYGIVTVKHVGLESTLSINTITFGGPAGSDFTVVSGPNPPGPLAVDQSATYTIQFVPSFGGTRNAVMTIESNGRDSGIQIINLTGFGVAPKIQVTPTELFKRSKVLVNDTVEQSIVISSIGAANLFFTNYPNGSFTLSGDNPGDYIVSRRPPNPLPAGGTDTLKIKFVPKAEGARPATLNINSNAENGTSIPVLLKGVGIIPRIEISPTYLDYDSTSVSTTQCQKITIYNPGSDALVINKHYFASNDGDFSFTPLVGSQLVVAPLQSVQVDVCFTPLQKGTRQARFRVQGKIPMTVQQFPRDTSYVDVEIRGNATPLDNSVIAMKDFSNDPIVGHDAVTSLELSNVGTDPVVVKAPVITGANASEFTVSKVNFPATVAPGSSISMTVTAKPLARGERNANIAFNLTSEGRPYSVNADVKATALVASASCVSSAVTFEKLLLGESITKTVELTNTGDIDQTFIATLTGSDAFSVDNTAIEVLSGAKGLYTVTFAPQAEGKATASLTIKGAHIADMTVALNGIGEKKEVVTQSVGKVSEMDGFSLEQNAPNPAVGYTNFSFTAPKQSAVRLYLADMSGKVVREIANSNFSGGKHSITMDTKELASGSYVYILESGATRIMRQMVVTK